jgi:DNA polymerase I-like protein with 3'-5' exonuclease and polymerase domains
MPQAETMEKLRPIWQLEDIIAVRHNGIFDDAFLYLKSGLDEPLIINNTIADSMLADYVADERRKRYGLKLRVGQVFGHKMTTYNEAVGGQATFGFAKKKPLGAYACDDCAWTYRLWKWAMESIRAQDPPKEHKDDWCSPLDDTPGVYSDLEKIFWKIEMKIQRILMEMEITGCFIDWEHLVTVQERLELQKKEIEEEFKTKVGWLPNLRSPKQVSDFLYRSPEKGGLGLPTKGVEYNEELQQYATGDKAISHRKEQFPLVAKMLKYRSLGVIESSFCKKLIGLAQDPDHNGRVYARFRQTGTVIGRLSSADPVNLMNQPRDKDLIRKAFCAHLEDDHDPDRNELCLIDADYCVEEGTLVSTHRGMVPIEDVVSGEDQAVLESGLTATISNLIDKGPLPIVEVRTKMGYTLRATTLHRVRVVDVHGDYEWRRIGHLLHTDRIAVQSSTLRGEPQPLPGIEFTHHNNNREIVVPRTLDETAAELIGYIIGDGTIQRNYVGVVVTESDEDVMKWCLGRFKEVFNAEPYQEAPRNGALSAKVMSKPLAEWFRKVGISKQSLLDVVWSSGEAVACALLRGLFEADGSIGRPSNGQRISVSGVSEELMAQVHRLLLGVGIPGVLRAAPQQLSERPLWTITIPSAYAADFSSKINFIGGRKRACLEAYCKGAGYSSSYGSYPNLQDKVCQLDLTGEVRRLLNNTSSLGRPVSRRLAASLRESYQDIYETLGLYRTEKFGTIFDEVASIEPAGVSNVYDLSVPGPTTYVSNGFVSHNSQMELRMAAHLSRDKSMTEVFSNVDGCANGPDGGWCERYTFYECFTCHACKTPVDTPDGPKCADCGAHGANIEHQKRCRHVDPHQRTSEDVGVPRNPLAKCLDGSTLVLGAEGASEVRPRPIKSLIGDIPAGEHHPLDKSIYVDRGIGGSQLAHAPTAIRRHRRPTKIVVTKRAVVIATEDHRFQVIGDYDSLDPSTPSYAHVEGRSLVEAQNLEKGMKLPMVEMSHERSRFDSWHETAHYGTLEINPFTKRVEEGGPATIVLDEKWAYFAGAFAGDGCASGNSCSISHGHTSEYKEWRSTVREACDAVGLPTSMRGDKRQTAIGSRVVRRYLSGLRICEELGKGDQGAKIMRVPPWVLSGGPKMMWSYIAGIFDTDGTVGKKKAGTASFTTKSPEFAGQMAFMLRWLGMPVLVQPGFNKTYERWYYTVHVLGEGIERFAKYCPMRFKEKVGRLHERAATIKRKCAPSSDEVLAVIDGGDRTVYDFQIDTEDHLYNQGGLMGHNNANFGLLYRMGAPKFCVYAGLYDEDGNPRLGYGQELINRWHKAYPGISVWHEREIRKLISNDYIAYNIARRRRRLDIEWQKNDYRAGTQAIQFAVSGSCQDLIKLAMIKLYDARNAKVANSPPAEARLWSKFRAMIQVHDELIFEGAKVMKEELCQLVKACMEGAANGMRVPFSADARFGRTWDELH